MRAHERYRDKTNTQKTYDTHFRIAHLVDQ